MSESKRDEHRPQHVSDPSTDRPPLGKRLWLVVGIGVTGTALSVATWQGFWPLPPGGSLFAGLAITALLTMYVHSLIGRAARVEQLVVRRAADLKSAKERLEKEIADRRRAEQALRESEAIYHALVESLPLNVFRKDLEGKVVFGNQRYCDTLGRPLDQLVGKTDFDLFPRELATKYREDDARVVNTGQALEDVEEHRKPDGELIHVHVLKAPVRDFKGAIVGVQGMFWDVTARRKAEAALERERYLLHALMDNLPHNIYFKDAQSRFLRVNKALAKLFGLFDAAEAVGKTDADFFTDEHARPARADEQEVMRTGTPLVDKEEKETWPNGRETWVNTTKLPLYNEHGEVVGTFGISRDITERKRAAEAIRAAKEAAEAASRAKSLFLANMSHEIRTPMNVIIGMTELVLDSQLSSEQREYLTAVQASSEALLSLINDVLDFSKIEAGKLDLDEAVFDLHESLGDTTKWLAMRAHGKGLELACHIRPDVPVAVVGDQARLRQVIVNLLGNAIKFTDQGEVVLDVRRRSQSDGHVELHFTVTDTGIGIPDEKLDVIFGAFEQADPSTTRRFGGTGLGLAISSKLVDLMGGRIWAESRVGEGSTFHFTARLGLAREEPAARPTVDPGAVRGTRVLVVDDNATNLLILTEVLSNWGMVPTTAPGVRDALRLLDEAHQTGNPFPLVISDVHMPDADGFSLVEQVKADPTIGSTMIMMLTSGDHPGDIARCETLGVAAYLLKPVKQSELLEAVMMALGITTWEDEKAGPAPQLRPPQTSPLRILLAEDSLVNQKLATGLLSRQGHSVTVASNGKEALAALELQQFDLMIMDVQMPEMDGLETTAAIRARERKTGGHLPIIAMTAHALQGDRERCLAAGMDRYVTKPIRAKQLYEVIEGIAGSSAQADVVTDTPLNEGDEFDLEKAMDAVRGDHDLLKVVVETVLEEAPRLLEAIREAIAHGDTAALRLTAHTLKGSIRYFGHGAAYRLAYRLEEIGREGQLQDAREALAALEGEMARLTPILLDYERQNGATGDP